MALRAENSRCYVLLIFKILFPTHGLFLSRIILCAVELIPTLQLERITSRILNRVHTCTCNTHLYVLFYFFTVFIIFNYCTAVIFIQVVLVQKQQYLGAYRSVVVELRKATVCCKKSVWMDVPTPFH